jgi:hypothetical protein
VALPRPLYYSFWVYNKVVRNHRFRLWGDFDSSDVAFTAEQTTKEIDVTDLPFLALALALSSPIWTTVVHLKWRRLQYRERALHWAALWYSKPPTLIKETVVAKLCVTREVDGDARMRIFRNGYRSLLKR